MGFGFLAIVLSATALAADSSDQVFLAIRNNDLVAVQRYAAEPATRDVRGKNDFTPLMYAASFGSTESVRILADAGAEINAQDARGGTPLIYGAWDLARTRILIGKGADVNVMSKMGRTPLIVALRVLGNSETVRLLMEKGANVDGEALVSAATYDPETAKMLVGKGVDVNSTNPKGHTALQFAAAARNTDLVNLLLAKGAAVDKAGSFSNKVRHGEIALKNLTPLMVAVPDGSPSVVKALLASGANVNLRDVRGMTALMLAVACDDAQAEIVRMLIANGADINVRSEAGETTLDWARKFGNPAILRILEASGAKGSAVEDHSGIAAPAKDARMAVSRAVPLIQNSGMEFFRQSGCPACHNVGTSGLALQSVRSAGLTYDEKAAAEMGKSIGASVAPLAPALLQRIDIGGQSDSATFMLTAMETYDRPPDGTADSFINYLAGFQNPAGNWGGVVMAGVSRAPMEDSDTGRTAFAVRALKHYGWPARMPEFESRIARARAWLLETQPATSYGVAEQLLGLKWSGAESAQIARVAKKLISQQKADGGWSQNPYLPSDAYATGLAMWALHETGARPSDAAYRKGKTFLLKTQRADGSWYVRSRAPKFQPYFEGGFPYSHDQWISNAATAYATVALAPAAGSSQVASTR
jgi:ankyrin repeat protein